MLALVALALLVLSAPSHVLACQCAGGLARADWPSEGGEVPLDPVFVVETIRVGVHLWPQAGDAELPLEQVRVFHDVDCFDVQFVRPKEPLAAGQTYELRAGDAAERDGQQVLVQFSAVARVDEPLIQDLPVSYYKALPLPGCGPSPSLPCEAQAEVLVGEHELHSEAAGWLVVRYGEQTRVARFGEDEYSSYALAFRDAKDDSCIEYELVDRRGVTRRAETLCKPSKCAQLGVTHSDNSCSVGPSAWGPSVWERVQPVSCDPVADEGAPSVRQSDAGVAGADLEEDLSADHASVGTCAVKSESGRTLPWGWLFLAVLSFTRVARHRVRAFVGLTGCASAREQVWFWPCWSARPGRALRALVSVARGSRWYGRAQVRKCLSSRCSCSRARARTRRGRASR